jgi:lipopolysaccharide cholinephosphotransferase
MNQLTLVEIKQIEFQILQKFKSFCNDNNIQYYLSNGTLLGAVKYRGFIPWDDDIDVMVPREDYDRLVRCFKDDKRYRLFSFERNEEFLFTFAKLCDMSTVKEETNINNGMSLGIDIDIFPLDAWDNNPDMVKRELKVLRGSMFRL